MPTGRVPQLGFRTAGYREWTLREAFESIGASGFDGVEVCLEHPEARPEDLTPSRAGQLADMVRAAGLEVASVSYHGDDDTGPLRRENQRRAVVMTPHFGGRVCILNSGGGGDGPAAEKWARFRADLEALLPMAEAEGVVVAVEPEPGHVVASSADMARLLEELPHPSLAVNLDLGHAFLTDDDVTETITALGPRIAHTHVEGMAAGVHQHLVPGEGDLDLAAAHRSLQAVGYAGTYTVDLFHITDDPEQYARRSAQALRRIVGG